MQGRMTEHALGYSNAPPAPLSSLDCGRKPEHSEGTCINSTHKGPGQNSDLLSVRRQCCSLHHHATSHCTWGPIGLSGRGVVQLGREVLMEVCGD